MVTPKGLLRIRWNPGAQNLIRIQVAWVMGSQGDTASLLDTRSELRGQDVG